MTRLPSPPLPPPCRLRKDKDVGRVVHSYVYAKLARSRPRSFHLFVSQPFPLLRRNRVVCRANPVQPAAITSAAFLNTSVASARSLSLFLLFFLFFLLLYGFRYERLFILKSTHQGVILVLLDKSDKKRVLVYNNAIALLVCWFRQTNEQNEMRRRRSRPCSRCCRSRCVGVGVGCWFGCRRRAHTRQKHV